MNKYTFDCTDPTTGKHTSRSATSWDEEAARDELGRNFLVGALLEELPQGVADASGSDASATLSELRALRRQLAGPRRRGQQRESTFRFVRYYCPECDACHWKSDRGIITYIIAACLFPIGLLLIMPRTEWICRKCGRAEVRNSNPNGGLNIAQVFAMLITVAVVASIGFMAYRIATAESPSIRTPPFDPTTSYTPQERQRINELERQRVEWENKQRPPGGL